MGMAPGGGESERVRHTAEYLREDAETWQADDVGAPELIGALADHHRPQLDGESLEGLESQIVLTPEERFELSRLRDLASADLGEIAHLAVLPELAKWTTADDTLEA